MINVRSTVWIRFDAAGTFVGSVTLPAGFTPHHVTRETLLGVQRDDLGVEYVVRYRVTR